MRDWIQNQLNAGLPAFEGTSISGTVAVTQELMNELLSAWLAEASTGARTRGLDVGPALRCVKEATVRAETGRLLVDFRLAV